MVNVRSVRRRVSEPAVWRVDEECGVALRIRSGGSDGSAPWIVRGEWKAQGRAPYPKVVRTAVGGVTCRVVVAIRRGLAAEGGAGAGRDGQDMMTPIIEEYNRDEGS